MNDAINENSHHDIPLADMIQALRRELEKARENAIGQEITFETEKVELELQVTVSNRKTGQGGIDFWVKVGGEYEKSNEAVHTFKLTLLPTSAKTGKRLNVNEETERKPAGLSGTQQD